MCSHINGKLSPEPKELYAAEIKTGQSKKNKEVTINILPHLKCIRCVQVTFHLKCIRLVSRRSNLPCIYTGVRIELTKK